MKVFAESAFERDETSPQSHCELIVQVGGPLQDGSPSGELSLAVMPFLTHISDSIRVRETRGVVTSRGDVQEGKKRKKEKLPRSYVDDLCTSGTADLREREGARHSFVRLWVATKLDFFVSSPLGARGYLTNDVVVVKFIYVQPTTVSGAVIYEIRSVILSRS